VPDDGLSSKYYRSASRVAVVLDRSLQKSTSALFSNGGISNTLTSVKRMYPLTLIRRKALINRLLWEERERERNNRRIWQRVVLVYQLLFA
jgi:hypothetical protein